MTDKINHPAHYDSGNVVKYVLRAGHRDGRIDDLRKARCSLDREIERESR